MTVSLSDSSIYTDIGALKGLKRAAAHGSDQALEKTAEQFEGMFLQMMLKSMRQTSLGEGMFESDQTRFYQQMFDQQIALEMAKKRQAGIADMIVQQLKGEEQPVAAEGDSQPNMSLDRLRIGRAVTPTALQAFAPPANFSKETIKGFESPQDFVEKLMPLAEKYAPELGVEPKVLLAQAALETGWGKHVTGYTNGVSTHSLFNIKADHRWDGERAVVPTLEYRQGRAVREYAAFRAYPDFDSAFKDYVDFIRTSPRYQEALSSAADGAKYVEKLHQAGYATDPNYANKIKRIMSGEVLGETHAQLKKPTEQPIT